MGLPHPVPKPDGPHFSAGDWSFTYEDARKAVDLAELFPKQKLIECCHLLGGKGATSVRVDFDVRHGIARMRRLVVTGPEVEVRAPRSQTVECIEHVYAGRKVPASGLPAEFTLGPTCATPEAR